MGQYNISVEELIRKIIELSENGAAKGLNTRSGDDEPLASVGQMAGYLNRFRSGLSDGRIEFSELKTQLFGDAVHAYDSLPDKKDLEKMGGILLKDYLNKVEANMESVVMVVPESSVLEAKGSSSVLIWSEPLHRRKVSETYSICAKSPYAKQPSAFALGTGFFVKKNVVATAAHLLAGTGTDIEKIRFIHGVRIARPGDFEHHIIVHKSQVFRPSRVAGTLPEHQFEFYADGADWALVEVTNAYEGFGSVDVNPVKRTSKRRVQSNDLVYAIGHGLGLPVKVSFDGKVKDSIRNSYFETSLTLLGGNSGSPVFFADTHEIAGIYMRGVKKLHLEKGGSTCLVVRNEDIPIEGQECQVLEPVYRALEQYF